MEKEVRQEYKEQLDEARRCLDWFNLDSTKEFLKPLQDKLAELQNLNTEELIKFDDKTFRSKIEARFLAKKDIEDYFNILQDKINSIKIVSDSLKGKDVDDY